MPSVRSAEIQPILDDGEQIVRQVRDIGHGLMLDLAILAKRPAEVRRNVDLAFGAARCIHAAEPVYQLQPPRPTYGDAP